MSELTERVADIVAAIPAGRAMTYGDVARLTNTGARAVGRILHSGGHEIPWWRVVDAGGRPYSRAAHRARVKFLEESTPLIDGSDDDVRVDLVRASWSPHNA